MIVDIRASLHTDPQWAAELRRNLLEREEFRRPTQFFMVATPDRLYLWKGPKTEVEVLLPDFVVDSRPLFLPYLQRPQGSSLDLDRLSPSTFELVVISWLSDLIYGSQRAESLGSEQAWLTDSGFLDAAKDGSLSYGLAA
jgi:hypothetical protein